MASREATIKKIREIMQDARRCENHASKRCLEEFAYGIARVAEQLGVLEEGDITELLIQYS